MNDDVRGLGQQFMAAAWNTARTNTSRNHATELDALLSLLDETQAQIAGLKLHLIHEARMNGVDVVTDRVRATTRTTTAQATAALRLSEDLAERGQAPWSGVAVFPS